MNLPLSHISGKDVKDEYLVATRFTSSTSEYSLQSVLNFNSKILLWKLAISHKKTAIDVENGLQLTNLCTNRKSLNRFNCISSLSIGWPMNSGFSIPSSGENINLISDHENWIETNPKLTNDWLSWRTLQAMKNSYSLEVRISSGSWISILSYQIPELQTWNLYFQILQLCPNDLLLLPHSFQFHYQKMSECCLLLMQSNLFLKRKIRKRLIRNNLT